MRKSFAFLVVAVLATVCSWASKFSTIYKVGDDNKWEMAISGTRGRFMLFPALVIRNVWRCSLAYSRVKSSPAMWL